MNGMKLAASAAIVGLVCACAVASAATTAGGTLTDFRIELIQDAPGNDAPWVTFDGGNNGFVSTTHGDGRVLEGGLTDYLDNPAPFQPGAMAVDDASGGSRAVVEGDVFGAGATVSVASFVVDGTDYRDAGGDMSFSGPQNSGSIFTLSGHTTIVISADADLYATDTLSGPGDTAFVEAYFRIKGTTSQGPQYARASLIAEAGDSALAGAFDHESGRLSISLTNPDAEPFIGEFRGFFGFDSQHAAASVVPEPSVACAMLAGLGLLAACARRRGDKRGDRSAAR